MKKYEWESKKIKGGILILTLLMCISMTGCGTTSDDEDTFQEDYQISQDIETKIQEGLPSDIADMLCYDVADVIVTTSSGKVTVTARAGEDYYIPAIAESLCPIVLDAISENECEISSITVQYYLEATDGSMDTSTLVDWHTYDGEAGVYTAPTNESIITGVTIEKLYDYYEEYYVSDDETEEETTEEPWYGDMLDAFQGEWQDGDSDWHLIIHGDVIDSLCYENYGDAVDEDNHSTYYFVLDEDGNLAVQKGRNIVWTYSINEEGQLVITGIEYGSTSVYDKVSDNTELPEIYTKVAPEIGMTESEVLASTWGSPNKRNKTTTTYGEHEQWVYDNGYIYFDDGIVTSIQKN